MKMITHYQVLGVAKDASLAEIKSAYRRLIAVYHPDRVGEHEQERWQAQVQRINQAYYILKDTKRRAEYDKQLAMGVFFGFSGVNLSKMQAVFRHNMADNINFIKETFQKNLQKTKSPKEHLNEHITLTVTPWQAALGEVVELTLQGRTFRLKLPENANYGTRLKVAGAGKSVAGQTGDLYIHIHLKNPSNHLTEAQRQAFLALKDSYHSKK
ncbi:MAG: DnaJ domain-containing protein [Moraxella sp.]|nr:DnaJ domain-containing protein [Moraxella sp.]